MKQKNYLTLFVILLLTMPVMLIQACWMAVADRS